MHGLLAAQLLGYEFQRTVCVDYPSFTDHFAYVDPTVERDCAAIMRTQQQQQPTVILKVVNYEAKHQDECRIQSLLRSDDTPILHFIGNSYPTSWPSPPLPTALRFDQLYRPRHETLLESLLPDIDSISHLVHLRVPDGPDDPREDEKDNGLLWLEQQLPHIRSTFLVTNQVALYQQFADCCGWSHPSWSSVRHSALSLEWTKDGVVQRHRQDDKNPQQQELQGWVDWYTILLVASSVQQNTTILHSRSDFSASAVHWSQKDHRSLVLPGRPEAWTATKDAVPMLRDRTCPTATTPQRPRRDDLLEGLEFSRGSRHWWGDTWMS